MSTKILKYPKWRTGVNNVSQPEPNYANVNQNMQCKLEYANVNQNMQVRVYIMSYPILLNTKNVSPFGNIKKKKTKGAPKSQDQGWGGGSGNIKCR